MPDMACQDACKAAYASAVSQCSKVLMDCLALAKNDADREQCKAHFEKCMALAKDARDICLATCG